MPDFDDALNRLLSDPEAMAEIGQLARSLNRPPDGSAPGDSPPKPGESIPAGGPPPGPANPPPAPPGEAPSGPPGKPPPAPDEPPPGLGNMGPLLGALLGGGGPPGNGDRPPDVLSRLLPLLRDLQGGGSARARELLYALRPYLSPRRQEKIERALQLARLYQLGKRFFQGEG